MFKKILSLYLCSVLIYYPIARADPPSWDGAEVTTLSEGEPAPFTGTLFSVEAATRLLVDLEYTQAACQIEIDREAGLVRSEMQFKIDNLHAELEACQISSVEIMEIKNSQIDFLDNELKRSQKMSPVLWFAIGVAGGIFVTGVAGWSLGQISQNQ